MTNPTPIRSTMIDTARSAADVQDRERHGRGRRRRRPPRRRGRDLRLPRPQRRRQDHDPADARDAHHARPPARRRSPAPTSRREPAAGPRSASATSPQGGSTDPAETGRGELVLQGRLYGMSTPRREARAQPRSSRRSTSRPPPTARPARTPAACAAGSTSGSASSTGRGVLFLDEPTTGLDPQARARMWDEIRQLREAGTTVFLTTHYLEEADALADRLAIIDHGRIVAEGTSDELKRQVAGDVVTIGVNGAAERVLDARRSACRSSARRRTTPTGVVRLYVDRGETAVVALLREPRRRRARGRPRSPSTGRASTTSSSARPAARCARRRHDRERRRSRRPTRLPHHRKDTLACERSATPG